METAQFQPIQQNQRIVIIDALRGWALLGVVLMNYIDYYYLGVDTATHKTGVFSTILLVTGNIVFSAKSWTMLSFLFGYGFAVLMGNTAAKGINANAFFLRRMFWLLVLAIINSALFWGDILKDYAVMGALLLLFHRCSAKTALYLCVALFLITPAISSYINSIDTSNSLKTLALYLPLYTSHNLLNVLWFGLVGTWYEQVIGLNYLVTVHIVMFACFLLGLAAQKVNFFGRLVENKDVIKKIFWYSLVAIIVLIGIIALLGKPPHNLAVKYYNFSYWIIIAFMLLIASGLCWLFLDGKLKKFFISMQVIGKMTLTNYIMQNAIGLLLFSGFGLGFGVTHKLDPGYYFLFALVIYIAQVYFSKWWLSKYYYGPVEWLWRQLSYGKRLPIKKVAE